MLKVEHVTKYYGDFKAVDDLSFTVKPGEVGTEMYATRDAGMHNSKRFIYFLPEQVIKTI